MSEDQHTVMADRNEIEQMLFQLGKM